ncbi:NADP-dependent oxidoreductase [Tunturibacter empetritectus]|uniref:NADPH:quinone reductase-like Zn-dependent oxidoreductase n=1 Tax=Tunturiibacter lichenicola TaxID=2051959 RepID=A0A7W8J6G1_9BACT|nr:NADP-dependent oxidoreductase [Edaphobacter lichenicola]MBB5342164.1 NADPH:quinone reductase-like Zn-dependent oxidoreductase [Edaphobacter lichenicola]
MKAVVLHEYGSPDRLKYEEWDDPQAGDGQILIRVTAAGINPIDWKIRSGAMKAFMPLELPTILGYDYSGVVRSVGRGVEGYAEGDKVFGRAGKTYAELLLGDLAGLSRLPDGLDLIEAAALPVVLNTGQQLITEAGKVQSGQTVVITGALGSVGRTAVWVAKKLGAHVIAGVRGSQKKAAEELGADALLALDSRQEMDSLGLVEVVADTIGGNVGEALMAKVKPGGTYASVVGPPPNAKLHPTVRVEAFGSHPDAVSMRSLAEDIAKGRFKISIDRTMPLADAAKAHAEAEKGGIGKILLLA